MFCVYGFCIRKSTYYRPFIFSILCAETQIVIVVAISKLMFCYSSTCYRLVYHGTLPLSMTSMLYLTMCINIMTKPALRQFDSLGPLELSQLVDRQFTLYQVFSKQQKGRSLTLYFKAHVTTVFIPCDITKF